MSFACADLRKLFQPKSVAVIGASPDATKAGGRVLRYLHDRFPGAVYPINPKVSEIDGRRTYERLDELPIEPDLAIIAVPTSIVFEQIESCAARGIKSALTFTSGFAELGSDGRAMQHKIEVAARSAGMRILGPNSLGFFNPADQVYATFSTVFAHGWAVPGNIGIVSQSGAIGVRLFSMARDRGLGFSTVVSTGNECDIKLGDCLRYLAEDDATRVIVGYIEGCRDINSIVEALDIARSRGKPVIVLKVGRTTEGAAAAASHTGSLAGSDAVFESVFAHHGAYRARNFEEVLDVMEACAPGVLPVGRGVGIASCSGGVGILMADSAVDAGLEVPILSEANQNWLKALVPNAAVQNPVDTTAAVLSDTGLLRKFLETILEEPDIGSAIVYLGSLARHDEMAPKLIAGLAGFRVRYPEKPLMLVTGATDRARAELIKEGFLVFEDPSRAVTAIAALAYFARSFSSPSRPSTSEPLPLQFAGEALSEVAALNILQASGVDIVSMRLATSANEAEEIATILGFPAVAKISSPDIPHKSEIGGVLVGLSDAAAVRAAYEVVVARVAERAPEARVDGVMVARQILGGVETIVGGKVDPIYGPIVLFGLGGIFVEVYRDVVFRPAPTDRITALEMIRTVRGFPLLDGVRGGAAADLEAIANCIVIISRMIASNMTKIESVEVNPLIALPSGAVAVDALIVPHNTHSFNEGQPHIEGGMNFQFSVSNETWSACAGGDALSRPTSLGMGNGGLE
jgi:acetate---CoA ligase (ADP-forming)